eukprot:3301737-Rhodomonas_salina.1
MLQELRWQLCGTAFAYGASTATRYAGFAMCGTEQAYGAACAVLSYGVPQHVRERMVRPGHDDGQSTVSFYALYRPPQGPTRWLRNVRVLLPGLCTEPRVWYNQESVLTRGYGAPEDFGTDLMYGATTGFSTEVLAVA